MQRIELLCSVGECNYEESVVAAFLSEFGIVHTRHGERFTGRPGTKLLVGQDHVIKLRTEYDLPEKDARKFIQRACSREQELSVYHPGKTWFLIFAEQGENPVIANITPRLQALHDVDAAIDILGETGYDDAICEILSIYLRIASEQEIALDISLSNFAVDGEGVLYYVDDEFYAWDRFTSLCHFLGTLIRSQRRIEETLAAKLGTCLRQQLVRYFKDTHWAAAIGEQLRGLFVPHARRKAVRALITTLTDHRTPCGVRHSSAAKVIALLADVHANAPALETALNYLARRNISEGLIMGDVVGYGPHPEICIDLLSHNKNFGIVKGNHDHAVASGNYGLGFSPFSKWVVEWSIKRLTDEQHAWLENLPLYIHSEQWIAVHGSPKDRTFFNAYVYDMTYEENFSSLEKKKIPYCFHGHTHLQKVYFSKKHTDGSSTEQKQNLGAYQHALICPGSIGQPRGGRPGCELALLDTTTWEIEFIRLSYDIGSTIKDMRRHAFPPSLIERLSQGK